ncbi:tRNA lysidine(34) synthetase TilS [Thioflexithrix psekupsensis]|uniref:tRNA(Ile)-lysidine synthase n=1 Tax=Thioflexithrix psekupsensis TaxID=1570016 RepID=A0A251XD87_9GAMM|nr:tRNA lysidine(34) synthetase TilS [Thioflexithrix psekupsensis]OUD16301.1 tRNA lysidine(34) synthetase TilS [Thioflexithrix psekupsensis]
MTLFSAQQLLAILKQYNLQGRLWVAYSGGLDSTVLLHALHEIRHHLPIERVCAVHVHHGLHPDADQWARHCRQFCRSRQIFYQVCRVDARARTGESVEARARDLRYRALGVLLRRHETVLTAQHADDQAETVLLQLLRGAGTAGLSGMAARSALGEGWRVRPLLSFTRTQLLGYAKAQGLTWIEDESNQDLRYDRSFIRQKITPLLRKRWPSFAQTLSRSAELQATATRLLRDCARLDWLLCRGETDKQLDIATLLSLSSERQEQVLRYWLNALKFSMPSRVKLREIREMLCQAKADRQPVVKWEGVELRRCRGQLYAMLPLPPRPPRWEVQWDLQQPLRLPLGELRAECRRGAGLLSDQVSLPLRVRLREGGERWLSEGHHRRLKKQLQALSFPPWWRAYLPLLYAENELLWVAGVGVGDVPRTTGTDQGWFIWWSV